MPSPARRLLASLVALALAVALAPVTPAAAAPPAARRLPAAPAAADSVIVQFADGGSTPGRLAELAAAGVETATAEPRPHGRVLVRAGNGRDAAGLARSLARRAGVRWAVPNIRMHATALSVPPNDTYYGSPLGGVPPQRSYLGPVNTYPYSIDLEPAWQRAFSGGDQALDMSRQGVTLALVDTGYTPTRESGSGVFVGVRNFVAGNTNTADDSGHGTEVGNILHAQTDNGFGVAGVQYGVPSKVLVFKVLGADGGGSMDNVLSGVESAVDNGAKVINLSLGGSGLDPSGQPIPGMQEAWDDAVAYAAARGALVVAAAGNENGPVDFPAAAKGAVAVGSIDPSTGLRSSFSSYGPQLGLVAPGQHILVYTKGGSVQAGAGTSFSSPIVAGSIGLLWSLLPKASPATIASAVTSTAHDLGATGFDVQYGNGEIDVWAAYRKLIDTFPTQPPMSVSVSGTPGFATTLTWPAMPGSDVVYRYGIVGGTTYTTTRTSGDVWVGADGSYTAFVSASATDMFSRAPATLGFTVATGRPPLLMRRFAGADRYGTAAAVSRAAFPTTAPSVVIASGEGFADALSASVLAFRSGAPLLLTRRTSLPKDTADEIARLHPSSAVIVGGTPAVSADVRAAVAGLVPSVTRIAGADRYETAEKVALAVRDRVGSLPSGTVVVASGENFPDALAASPMAAAAGYPVLLTRKGSLPAATSRAIASLGATRTILVGGAPAVSDAVAAALPSPTRIAGRNRYETSRKVADAAVAAGILGRSELGIATGASFPDALSGGVLMARLGGTMVLGDGGDPALDAWLARIGDSCSQVEAFGSETVVPAALTSRVLRALRGL